MEAIKWSTEQDPTSFSSFEYGVLHVECPATWRSTGGILILGEAPGEEEVRQQEGFVGKSGRLLTRLLDMAGLSRDDVSLSNVVKERPPFNKFSIFYEIDGKTPTPGLLAWHQYMWDEIEQHQPKVIVACGNEPLFALLGLKGIAKRRGSAWFVERPGWQGWVVGMLHPASFLHRSGQLEGEGAAGQWEEVPVAVKCLRLARELYLDSTRRPREFRADVVSHEGMVDFLFVLQAAERWSLDLETIPSKDGKGAIRCLGLAACWGDGVTEAVCCPWPSPAVWNMLQRLIEARGDRLVWQNGLYDVEWLRGVGVKMHEFLLDTMQGWHVLRPELPKGLEFMTMWYLGADMPYYKDEGQGWKKRMTSEQEHEYYLYNMKDCVATLWASFEIETELKARGLWGQMQGYYKQNWWVAEEMQSRAMLVDVKKAADLAIGLVEEADRRTLAMRELLQDQEFNPRSPKQVMAKLHERGVEVPQRKGKETTGEDALKMVYLRTGDELLRLILEARKLMKAADQYVLSLACKEEMWFGHTCDSTETFRFASHSHPSGMGFNLQTVPKVLRYLFPAPPGRVFIQPDLSQAEARYVAARSGCRPLLEVFADPKRNVHKERARAIFDREVGKEEPEYTLAKSSMHAKNYREGPFRFAEQAGITVKRAREIMAKDKLLTPEIERWHKEVMLLLEKQGRLSNCWGQVRECYAALGSRVLIGKVNEQVWKDCIAWEPQSAIPGAINRAIHQIVEMRESRGLDIWFHEHGHDAFLASIPVEQATQETKRLILEALRVPMVVGGRELVIPVELAVGYNWGWMWAWHDDCSVGWWQRMVDEERRLGRADELGYIVKDLLFMAGVE